jgi:predicted DNA-binding transcriptional regulator AlpA
LTIPEAAEMMGISRNAIYISLRRRTLRPYRPNDKPQRVALAEVVRRLDELYGAGSPSFPGIEVDQTKGALSRLLSYHEAAEYMGIAISTLSNRIGHGKRPRPIRCEKGSEKWAFRLADVVDAMDNPKRVNHNPEHEAYLKKVDDKRVSERKKYCIEYETILAQCPYCSEKRDERVVKGSSKWIFCKNHNYLRYKNSAEPVRTNLQPMAY